MGMTTAELQEFERLRELGLKKCTRCGEVKSHDHFYKTGEGLSGRCRECTSEEGKSYLLKNKEEINKRRKLNRRKNIEKYTIKSRASYHRNKEKNREKRLQYYLKNREFILAKKKEYGKKNSKSKNEYNKYLYRTNDEYRVKLNVSKRLREAIINKSDVTKNILGYGLDDLVIALGRIPVPGEHIDHKIPLNWFEKGSDPKITFSLSNLQILTASDNCSKADRYADPVEKEYYNKVIHIIKPEYREKVKFI